ncbi:MAG TPA: hypothetical protein VF688_15640 [Allosphingosinicella sp.]|jgi:hypothetical protein
MTLLTQDRIEEIYTRALNRDLADRRDTLLTGLGHAFVASLETSRIPADQMLLDLNDLNVRVRPVEGVLPLARWLRSAGRILDISHPPDSAFFNGVADLLVVPAELSIKEVAQDAQDALLSVRSAGAAGGWLPKALAAAREDLATLLDQLVLLGVRKQFHDTLHRVQMERLQSIQAQVNRDTFNDPRQRNALVREVNALSMPVAEIRSDFEVLPEDEPGIPGPRAEESTWIEGLDGIRSRMVDALKPGGTFEDLSDGLRDLRQTIKASMSRLNLALSDSSRILRITELADRLREVALQAEMPADPNAVRLRRTATRLMDLRQEIEALVRVHDQWQRIDDALWQVEDSLVFNSERPSVLLSVAILWPTVVKGVIGIAGAPPEPWLEETITLRIAFEESCPMPIKPPVEKEARDAFSGFTRATRQQFFELDTRLRLQCTKLVGIARPLRDMVRVP